MLFEIVCERLQLRRLTEAVLERTHQEPVGQPRVARQEGPVKVRADCRADPHALEAALAVIAEAGHHPAEWLRALVEARDAGVVLETRHRPAHARLEPALQQTVTDQAPLSGNRVEREDPGTRQFGAASPTVEPTEELVTAADGQHRCATRDRLADRLALRGEVGRNQRLLTILAAADVEQVVLPGAESIADADRLDGEHQAALGRSVPEHGDVAAVGVDVQVLGIQVRPTRIVVMRLAPSTGARDRARKRSPGARASRCTWGGGRGRRPPA